MVIGENGRPDDMDVNPTKSKALSRMRTQATDGDYRIHTPPRVLTLESAIDFIAADELVEVTPTAIRLRKRLLWQHDRRRAAGAAHKVGKSERSVSSYPVPARQRGQITLSVTSVMVPWFQLRIVSPPVANI
jgi:hypothetical protein